MSTVTKARIASAVLVGAVLAVLAIQGSPALPTVAVLCGVYLVLFFIVSGVLLRPGRRAPRD